MTGKVLFYYFGDDEAYFRALQGEFNKHTKFPLEFKRVYETESSKIQSLFLKVYREQPAAVFIDFSKQTQDYFHLARLIAKTPLETKVVAVGLVDYLSPAEVLSECNATGVDFTHIKSTETFDVVFDVTKLIAPNELGEHGFATTELKDEFEAGVTAKVGYIHSTGIHVETNHEVSKGSKLRIKHSWQKNRLVPSSFVFVKDVSKKNLFYHFSCSAELEFMFIDEVVLAEGMEIEDIKHKKAERDDQIRYQKKQLKKWLDDNHTDSQEKKGKMLVVDSELLFYDNQVRSDTHSYTIRVIPYLNEIVAEMDRTQPQVIAYSLDKPEVENPKNHHQRVVKLTEAIKAKYRELNPFIIVFNSPVSSQEMQEVLGYTNVMAINSELSVELLVKMADLYQKKKLAGNPVEIQEDRVYLKKSHGSSVCEFLINVKVLKLSETDIHFTCDQNLPIGSNIHLYRPVDMFVNVQPSKNVSNPPVYHGLIHCLGENEKKELRRFVNSVFFREHDAALQSQNDEFKKLNDTKLNEKITLAAKKVQEDLQKKEKEAAEKAERMKPKPAVEEQES